MKTLKSILLLWLALAPLLSQGQAGRKYYVEKNRQTGEKTAYIESSPGNNVFVSIPVNSLQAIARTPGSIAIPKFVPKTYPTENAKINFTLYAKSPQTDFVYTEYVRDLGTPLLQQFQYRQLIEDKALSEAEQADPSLKSKQYFDVPGGVLGPYEKGPAFVNASLQDLLNQVSANFNANAVGAARVSFNFEMSYLPDDIDAWSNPNACSDCTEDKGVLEFYPDAQTKQWIVEQEGPWKGQAHTLRELWDSGRFNAETAQRLSNRMVMIKKWYDVRCGSNTLVTLGDGNQVAYNGLVAFAPNYAELKNGGPRNYTEAFFNTGANFGSISSAGITVAGNGTKLWDIQDWVNNYHYVGSGYLNAADFDLLASQKQTYEWFWDRVEPGPESYDVGIPAATLINRAIMGRYGRQEIPIVWQGHNRFEFGVVKKGSNPRVASSFYDFTGDGGQAGAILNSGLGRDGAILPPYMMEVLAMGQRFVSTVTGDGITQWTTYRVFGPGAPTVHNLANNRKQWDRMGTATGLARIDRFPEYTTKAINPLLIGYDDMYVRYPGLTGGDWVPGVGQVVKDGGDGFKARGAGHIVNHEAPSWVDVRTKCGVMARVITKNNAKWALIFATNWRQGRNQTATFDVRFKAAEVPGLSSDVTITGLAVYGWDATLVEVCLEPAKLVDLISSNGGTTPTTPTNPGSGGSTLPYNFGWADLASTTPPVNGIIDFSGSRISGQWWISSPDGHKFGGAMASLKDGNSLNYVNHFDPGRLFQDTYWGGPVPYEPTPFQNPGDRYYIPPVWRGSPYNPLEGGDWTGQYASDIQAYGYDANTGWKFLKSRAFNFPTTNYRTGFIYRKWGKVVASNAFRQYKLVTWDRANDEVPVRDGSGVLTRFPAFAVQEHPCLFANDALYLAKYPTETGIATVDLRQYGETGGNYRGFRDVLLAKPWFALVGADGKGVGVVGPSIGKITGGFNGDNDSGGESGGKCSYLANTIQLNIDPVGKQYHTYDYVVGTVEEIEAYANSYIQVNAAYMDFTPNYSFSSGRHGWAVLNGTCNDEGTGGAMQVTRYGTEGVTLKSPAHPFQTSAVPTLYIRIKNTSATSTMRLTWVKPNQKENEALVNAGQYSDINIPNDGQWRTVAINMTGKPGWSGLVAQFSFGLVGNNVGSGLLYEISYIGKNNPGN